MDLHGMLQRSGSGLQLKTNTLTVYVDGRAVHSVSNESEVRWDRVAVGSGANNGAAVVELFVSSDKAHGVEDVGLHVRGKGVRGAVGGDVM
jgi:hypothetical protein